MSQDKFPRKEPMSAPMQGSVGIPFLQISSRVRVGYAIAVFVIALFFGGGTRHGATGDILIELLSLPLLVWNVATFRFAALSRPGKYAVCIAAAVPILLLVQLIPLPPSVWSILPGRIIFVSTYDAVKMPVPWMPLTLDRGATFQALMWTLPGLALFTTTMRSATSEREQFVWATMIVGVLSFFLSVLQMIGGQESSLRFYDFTNPDRAVGFFANANHNAAFLYCLLPLGAALIVRNLFVTGRRPLFVSGSALLMLFMVFVGLSLTHSRAGLALGLLSALLATVMMYTAVAPRQRMLVLKLGMAAGIFALLISFQFGFASLSERVESEDLIQDLRWPIAKVTLTAAAKYVPFGSGVGTFQPIYEMTAPRTLALPAYVNHAHDDWLELWLETGISGAAVLAAFMALFLFRSGELWIRKNPPVYDILFARSASIVILLLMGHSVVEYPLRTMAMASVLAVCCGFLFAGERSKRRVERIGPAPESIRGIGPIAAARSLQRSLTLRYSAGPYRMSRGGPTPPIIRPGRGVGPNRRWRSNRCSRRNSS